jgi:hypothetical protein
MPIIIHSIRGLIAHLDQDVFDDTFCIFPPDTFVVTVGDIFIILPLFSEKSFYPIEKSSTRLWKKTCCYNTDTDSNQKCEK